MTELTVTRELHHEPPTSSTSAPRVAPKRDPRVASKHDARATPKSRSGQAPKLELCELGETGDPAAETHSPFCLKVRRAMAAKGLVFTSRRGVAPSDHRTYNPLGQIPVLLVDGEAVYDSTEIVDALETWVPSELTEAERAESVLWEELADTALNGFVVASRWADEENWARAKTRFFADAPAPVRAIVAPMIRRRIVQSLVARDVWKAGPERCWARFEKLLDALERRAPERGGWCSASLGPADFALFGQLQSFRSDLTPSQRDAVERRPRLRAYLDRVDQATRVPTDA